MRLYDAHTHLNDPSLVPEWQVLVQHFIDAGGKGLINAGAREDFNMQGLMIAEQGKKLFPSCIIKASLGYHPEETHEDICDMDTLHERMAQIKALYEAHPEHVVAIGECGIDLHYPDADEDIAVQKELFHAHCKLAKELHLPLMVHSRDDFSSTLEVLKHYQDMTIYFHCRGYWPEEFKLLSSTLYLLHSTLYIGFCGNVSYKNADPLRETLKLVPRDRLVLETDAPWLSPQAVRGQVNQPANVQYIYEYVSDYLAIPLSELEAQLENNVKTLYKI